MSGRKIRNINIYRLILAHGWTGEFNRIHGVIGDFSDYLKTHQLKGSLLHTCGGFLQIQLEDLDKTWINAATQVKFYRDTVNTIKELKMLSNYFDYISFGVDVYDENSDYHAEFVLVIEPRSSKILHITGKSHPTQQQKSWLIKAPLESHFLKLGKNRILMLGCHDLHMFSPRAIANSKKGSDSYKRIKEMNRLTKEFKPNIILQHPHTTDSNRIWNLPWRNLERKYPGIQYSGAGKYYNYNGNQRSPLARIIKYDHSADVMTIVRYKNGKFASFSGELL